MLSAIIGIDLVSYLTLVRSQNASTMRSLTWNSAMSLSEAGVEEAFAHLNKNGLTNLGDLLSNDWQLLNGKYTMTRTLGDGYYTVTIDPLSPPVIESAGFVAVPSVIAYAPQTMFAAAGLPDYLAGRKFIGRTVRVGTTNAALFAKGMVAKGNIDLMGNNIRSDSFDSSDPLYSTNGLYTASKAKSNGDIATDSGLTNSLNVGNAKIAGHISTGPGGSVEIGPNGSVGDLAWVISGKKGIKSGWSTDDMNVALADVVQPFATASAPLGGTVDGTNYTYVVGSGNSELASINLSGSQAVLVTGDATLLVDGNISMTGNSYIYIAPGASLKLYVKGETASIGGNGIANTSGDAMNFYYYGLPSNTSVNMSGNAAFSGVIYAPSAALILGGGGGTDYDFVGASIANTVSMNGHYHFHYDEKLGKIGPKRGYVANSWGEI